MSMLNYRGLDGRQHGFDPLAARMFVAGRRILRTDDGTVARVLSMATEREDAHEFLYTDLEEEPTLRRVWVLHHISEDTGSEWWAELTADTARHWLIRTGNDGVVNDEPHLFPLPTAGRPQIGPQVSLSLSAATLERVDALAAARRMSRAAWLRAAIKRAADDEERGAFVPPF